MSSKVWSIAIAAALIAIPACAPTALSVQQTGAPQNASGQDGLASVSGQVVRSGTNEPLKKARVVLTSEDIHDADPYVAATDSSGRFAIEGIRPGRYQMYAEHDGYVSRSFGEDAPGSSSATLSLSANQRISDLLFRLQRCAAISGRVADEDGDPVQGIDVQAVEVGKFRGKIVASTAGTAETNDLGEYRIWNLPPGRYSLRANPTGWGMRTIGKLGLSESTILAAGGYIATYYPGVAEISRAVPIEVGSGDAIDGIDIDLLRQRSYKIRGQVINGAVTNLTSAAHVDLALQRTDSEMDEASFLKVMVTAEAGGEFEFDDVPPGSYTLVAFYRDQKDTFLGTVPVVVVSADVESVRVVITRGAELSGRVIREGNVPASAELKIFIAMSNPPSSNVDRDLRVKPDGTFAISGVPDGLYGIDAVSACDSCYLKSATANGMDLLKEGLRVSSGSAPSPIELVYSSRSGTVEGSVLGDDGAPAAGATVVFVPDSPRFGDVWPHPRESTDQFGRFVHRGLPPGNYHVYAWQKIDFDRYTDPDFLKHYEQKAQAFSISENERKALEVSLLPSPVDNP